MVIKVGITIWLAQVCSRLYITEPTKCWLPRSLHGSFVPGSQVHCLYQPMWARISTITVYKGLALRLPQAINKLSKYTFDSSPQLVLQLLKLNRLIICWPRPITTDWLGNKLLIISTSLFLRCKSKISIQHTQIFLNIKHVYQLPAVNVYIAANNANVNDYCVAHHGCSTLFTLLVSYIFPY